jgi:hypothetical protein
MVIMFDPAEAVAGLVVSGVAQLLEYNCMLEAASDRLNVTCGAALFAGDAGEIDTNEAVGPVVSITIFFCPPRLLGPPTAGKVKTASLPTESLTVAPDGKVIEVVAA